MLIIDGTVSHYVAEKWEVQAKALHLPCYVLGNGALEVNLNE